MLGGNPLLDNEGDPLGFSLFWVSIKRGLKGTPLGRDFRDLNGVSIEATGVNLGAANPPWQD